MAADGVIVRDGRREDLSEVLRMIHELAEYEGCPNGPRLTVAELEKDGFDESPPWYFLLVAESRDGVLVGYALCNRAYSSWTSRALYMEDLYVRPQYRTRGVGRLLITHLCKRGVDVGASRVDWHVLENNSPALRFYSSLGARDMRQTEGRAAMRLDREYIQQIADNNK